MSKLAYGLLILSNVSLYKFLLRHNNPKSKHNPETQVILQHKENKLMKLLTANELSSEPRTCLSLLTVFNFLSSATLATGKLSAAVVGVALKQENSPIYAKWTLQFFGLVHFHYKGCLVSFLSPCFIYIPALNANSVDPDQMWHLIWVYTVCQCPIYGTLG